ncbi:oxidoreductase [Virgibacillus profundi]|uniref:Oxidoreductase n=1 Tax=Virgibacillus profundi TaxID=2024555 RepID=A0A2A2I8D6_9BACI|nr:sialidase family protein [Virgibacillus profundi]PAV27969.1 oxidoreductase [Virgibacillus profundi]PXY52147.1 exo-alpha-sialidase [Virgibacillus profundi]
MKKLVVSVASIMKIGLIIAIILYQKPTTITQLHPDQTIDEQENQESLNDAEKPKTELLQPIHIDDPITYSLQNDELNITFDKGSNWITVPVEKDQLFDGEYNGNKRELIEVSYVLTQNRAAFLYSDGMDWDNKRILLTYSLDQGKTWKESVVTKPFPAMRFRKVDFLNDKFGYVIISGGRTMSQEFSTVFLTHDGGESWEETTNSGVTRLISDGGFIDETTGFLSFGTINPEEPDLYVTQDAGNTWTEAKVNIPAEYKEIFVQAEVPVKEGGYLAVLINQGPNGDYKGGKVKGKFISKDNGKTWEFQVEVNPNETEG